MLEALAKGIKYNHAQNPMREPLHSLPNIESEHFNQFNVKERKIIIYQLKLVSCHFHSQIERQVCTCRISCRSTSVISAFIVLTSRKSCAFVYGKRAKCKLRSWVLAQLVYALLAGHKRYL